MHEQPGSSLSPLVWPENGRLPNLKVGLHMGGLFVAHDCGCDQGGAPGHLQQLGRRLADVLQLRLRVQIVLRSTRSAVRDEVITSLSASLVVCMPVCCRLCSHDGC